MARSPIRKTINNIGSDSRYVRDTLERWGLIPKGSPKSAVARLGIKVAKVLRLSKDPVKACLGFLEENPTDLIVLAVRQHERGMRWLGKSVAKPIAHGAGQMTLFTAYGVEASPRDRTARSSFGTLSSRSRLTSPTTQRGIRRASDPQPPIASWHGHVAPRRTHSRNALTKAPQGHRLDLEQGGQGR
jgi:hypothetical protein